MARLPQPIIGSIEVTWPNDYKERLKTIYEVSGQAVRKRNADEKRKEEEKEEE